MIRGTILFICTQCKKVFLALDIEYNATSLSVSMPCERCGSTRTMPLQQVEMEMWVEEMDRESLEDRLMKKQLIYKGPGAVHIEQKNTPDEQYHTGMMYLNGTLRICGTDDVAFYWLMKAAKQGHAQAQYQVGKMLCHRSCIDEYLQNPPFCYTEGTTFQWMSKAAEQGLPEAMCYLGNMYHIGKLIEKNLDKAFAWHLKASMAGCAASEYAIACLYKQGEGVERNTFRALRWCRKAALHECPEAQLRLGIIYESTGKERHFLTASTFYRQAAQQKPEAWLWSGIVYDNSGKEWAFYTDFSSYQWSAQQKQAEAWQRLALLYEIGKGVEQDFQKAWECYLNAWKVGNEKAYLEAKRLLGEGLANPEISTLKEWYRDCITQGHKEMWYDLGKIYYDGKVGERNLKEAFQCYLIAARTAHVVEAQYALGCMYEQGKGVQPDLQKAVRWYKEAAEQGHVEAQAACGRLKEHEEQL